VSYPQKTNGFSCAVPITQRVIRADEIVTAADPNMATVVSGSNLNAGGGWIEALSRVMVGEINGNVVSSRAMTAGIERGEGEQKKNQAKHLELQCLLLLMEV
jgi:hypothetical protein